MKIDFDRWLSNVVKDVKVELDEEFDRNFERKAFFNTPWVQDKVPTNRGSLMLRTGSLRRSIKSRISGDELVYSSSHPAAAIHNEGGKIKVTLKMKKFFWAMFYKASGDMAKKKDGTNRNTKANRALSAEAKYYKGLALMRVGSELVIPKRQFIGMHPEVDASVRRIADDNVQELAELIRDHLQSIAD